MRHILSLFIFFSIISARQAACLDTATENGKPAPSFALENINGEKAALADYKGMVVLLNFWATYCGPCKKEMPSLHNLFLAFKKDGLIVLAVSRDEDKKNVQSFIKKQAITFPVLMDKDQEVSFDHYAVHNLPTSFLIDRDGIIRETIIGEREWDAPDMKKKIGSLLSSKKGEMQ
ncbi:MAG: redoxin domain-containing protein [Nitrospirae bacterium]|nr:redoxin domain-containing protein [Nitrospirota bacterium]